MKSFIAALRNLVLPWGRTSGERIVLNGDDGRIEVYNAANQLVYYIDASESGAVAGPSNVPQVRVYSNGVNGVVEFPTNDPNEVEPARMATAVYNQGTATERLAFEMQGPSHDVDSNRIAMQMNSSRADLSTPPNVQFFDVATQNLILYMDNDRVQVSEALQVAPESGDVNIPVFVNANPPAGTPIVLVQKSSSEKFQVTNEGRIRVIPDADANSAIYVNAASGYTGPLTRLQVNAVDQYSVDPGGILTTYAANGFTTYTPTVGGGGTVTWTTRTGWWMRVGKMVYVCVYLVVNAAGSGAATVSVDMPTSVYRGTRQTLTMHTESVGPNGSHIGNGEAVFFTGGSGATADRLRTSSNDGTNRDSNITGVDLLAAGNIVIQGWYREA